MSKRQSLGSKQQQATQVKRTNPVVGASTAAGLASRYYVTQQQSTAGKKTLKHTATTYDFLQDHSQKVGPQVRPELASIRFTERSTNIFEPKKYENDEVSNKRRKRNSNRKSCLELQRRTTQPSISSSEVQMMTALRSRTMCRRPSCSMFMVQILWPQRLQIPTVKPSSLVCSWPLQVTEDASPFSPLKNSLVWQLYWTVMEWKTHLAIATMIPPTG
jgi:hypothetical protein